MSDLRFVPAFLESSVKTISDAAKAMNDANPRAIAAAAYGTTVAAYVTLGAGLVYVAGRIGEANKNFLEAFNHAKK